MSIPTIWDGVLAAGVIGAAIYLRSYLREKGRNLASKEDVEELTGKVEGVRAQYVTALERLRFDLERASLVHKARYETEFRVYEDIWARLVAVQRAVATLRPMVDYTDPNETDAQRRARRLSDFGDSFNEFQTAVWKNKPFYAAEVHQELQKLSGLMHGEAVDYQHGDVYRDDNYWYNQREHAS